MLTEADALPSVSDPGSNHREHVGTLQRRLRLFGSLCSWTGRWCPLLHETGHWMRLAGDDPCCDQLRRYDDEGSRWEGGVRALIPYSLVQTPA